VGLADLSVKYKEEANHVSHVPRNEKKINSAKMSDLNTQINVKKM
jgi:hypothetical protein